MHSSSDPPGACESTDFRNGDELPALGHTGEGWWESIDYKRYLFYHNNSLHLCQEVKEFGEKA